MKRGGAFLCVLFAAGCGQAVSQADDERIDAEQSALGSECPTAPDTPSWTYGWSTVHGPIGAVWSRDGQVVQVEHVYEFRAAFGILIPAATRKNCYRVWLENEAATTRSLFVEAPGQPNSMDFYGMLPPGYVVVPANRSGSDFIDVTPRTGARWSVARPSDACTEPGRLIPSPDGTSLAYASVTHACAGTAVTAGSRVTLRRYDPSGKLLVGDRSTTFAGSDPYVVYDSAGRLLVTDGTATVRWADDGSFVSLPAVPACNRMAPTSSGPIDAQGRFLFWNGGANEISAPGSHAPFGC